MTIKQQGGIFGRNPTYNDVTVDGSISVDTISEKTSGSGVTIDGFQAINGGAVASANSPKIELSSTNANGYNYRLQSSNSGYFTLTQADGSVLTGDGTVLRYNPSGYFDIYQNLALADGKGILCGVTSTDRNAVVRADLSQGVVGSAVYISRSGGSTAKSQIEFANSNGVVGSITTSGSATAYNTSSDYRLKTDVQPMTGASDRVKSLSPINFEWISDGTRVDGFIAHEVQEIVPEAVHGAKDAMREEEYEVTPAVLDEEGNIVTEAVIGTRQVPDYQAIDQSKLVPLLTAALQEALAKIEQLEGRVASLEV